MRAKVCRACCWRVGPGNPVAETVFILATGFVRRADGDEGLIGSDLLHEGLMYRKSGGSAKSHHIFRPNQPIEAFFIDQAERRAWFLFETTRRSNSGA